MTEYSDISFTRDAQPVGNSETLSAVLSTFGETLFKRLECCTPAIVEEYYPDMGMARVRPLVMQVMASGQATPCMPLTVSVMQHQAGNFLMHCPLTPGDTGWLIAADKDTSAVRQRNSCIAGEGAGEIGFQDSNGRILVNAGPQRPNTFARHQYSQGFFIPDRWGGILLPERVRDSFVIQTIDAAHQTHGRFALDKYGSVHIMSERWVDKDSKERGGLVNIELRYRGIDAITNKPFWSSGEVQAFANSIILGDQHIRSWIDEYNMRHGGNLHVEGDAQVGANLSVAGNAHVEGGIQADKPSLFKGSVIVETDNKKAIIDPKEDLYKTDAKFREVTVVTGLKEQGNTKVKLYARKMRVLADEPVEAEDVEIEIPEGEGTVVTDGEHILPFYIRRKDASFRNQCVCYLPAYSLQYNGEYVEFANISLVGDDWYTMNDLGATQRGTIWCWIEKQEDAQGKPSYVGHFVNSAAGIQDKEGFEAYFAVADVQYVFGEGSLYEGITQIAAGEMVIGATPEDVGVPFDLEESQQKDGDEQPFTQVEVKNPKFYWNGEIKTVRTQLTYNKAALSGKQLYLNIKEGEPELSKAPIPIDIEKKWYSYQLYSFDANGDVELDLRHSFLELNGASSDKSQKPDHVSIDYKDDSDDNSDASDEEKDWCIKGWWSQEAIEKSLADIIHPADPDESPSEGEYEVVARENKKGPLQYIKIGTAKQMQIEGDSPIYVTQSENVITIHISGSGGGGGGVDGYTGNVVVNPTLEWASDHTLVLKGQTASFQNGLLVAPLGAQQIIQPVINTTPHSQTVAS